MSGRFNLRRIGLALAAPVLAILFALLVTSVVLIAAGNDPVAAFSTMLDQLTKPRIQVILRGRIVGEFDPAHVTPEQLGSAMTGAEEGARA